ncbi:hypothetical protein DXG01_002736 [Tephrocybe rancida]|nr:hypothetical protein DXG01_002736 [Tephrocybe rancida]
MVRTILAPLSSLDQTGMRMSRSLTLGYVLKSAESAKIEVAAKRMVDKWRILAGRPEWSEKLSTWCIRIPLEGDVSHRLKFTTSKLDVPLDMPLTVLGEASAEILARPALHFFRHPATQNSLSGFASSNTPIVSIHVTELTNFTCVGISVPHGVFDVFGLGQIVRSLDAKMWHKPWVAPDSHETNIVRETLSELAAAPPLYAEEPPTLADVLHHFDRLSVKNIVTYLTGNAYEYLWQKAHCKAVYLGEAVVKEMVQKVKDEVRESGAGWVSTGDVLVAWFLKTSYTKETDTNSVSASSTMSLRSTFADKCPAFDNYPHNGTIHCCMPTLTKAELAAKPLSELAVLHRQTIDAVRNVPFIQAHSHWQATLGGRAMPIRTLGVDSWAFTNHVTGHFDEIDFGSEMVAYWVWAVPVTPDHKVVLNKLKGGYIIQAVIRSSRWDAIVEDVERLKASCKA